MRARLAIESSGTQLELREILLKDKPIQMTSVSEKATVPVLVLADGEVIDESLAIMYWALQQHDPDNLLAAKDEVEISQLIEMNDVQFKPLLDKYKYAVRFLEKSQHEYRKEGEFFLQELESRLIKSSFLLGRQLSLADIAIFPFIRQFAAVNRGWFDNCEFDYLKKWLEDRVESAEFDRIMIKYKPWVEGETYLEFSSK